MGGLMGKDSRSATRRGGVAKGAEPETPPSDAEVLARHIDAFGAEPVEVAEPLSGSGRDTPLGNAPLIDAVDALPPGLRFAATTPPPPSHRAYDLDDPDMVALPSGRSVLQCTLCTRAVGSCPRECPDESVLLSPEWASLPTWTLNLVRRLFGERASAFEILQAERAGWEAKLTALREDLLAAQETRGVDGGGGGLAPGRVLDATDDVVDAGTLPTRPPAPSSVATPAWRPSLPPTPAPAPAAPSPPPRVAINAPGGVTACSCKHLYGASCPRCKGTGWVSA